MNSHGDTDAASVDLVRQQEAVDTALAVLQRCALTWRDRSGERVEAKRLAAWARADGALWEQAVQGLERVVETKRRKYVRNDLINALAGGDCAPLLWGWAAVDQGATFGSTTDMQGWVVRNSACARTALLCAWLDGWTARVPLTWEPVGPTARQRSLVPEPRQSLVSPLAAALAGGAWVTAERLWAHDSSPATATEGLRALVEHVAATRSGITSAATAEQSVGTMDHCAAWLERLLAAGANPNERLPHDFVGGTGGGSGIRFSPKNTLQAPNRLEEELKNAGWVLDRSHARAPLLDQRTTERVEVTVSELALIGCLNLWRWTWGARKQMRNEENAPSARALLDRGAAAVARWTHAWIGAWQNTPPVLALPWHAHGSALDVLVHHMTGSVDEGDGLDVSGARVLTDLVRALADQEAAAGRGWWTRAPTPQHPWPAWWTTNALVAGEANSTALKALAAVLHDTLLEVAAAHGPLPPTVLPEAAEALVEYAGRHMHGVTAVMAADKERMRAAPQRTGVAVSDSGDRRVELVVEGALDRLKKTAARVDGALRPVAEAWVDQLSTALDQAAQDLMADTDANAGRVAQIDRRGPIRDRLSLVAAAAPMAAEAARTTTRTRAL